MKKIYYALALMISLSSCSMFRNPATLTSTALDYSAYHSKGFFLSESNSVSFNYEPIASVSALNMAGYQVSNKPGKTFSDDIYGTSTTAGPGTTSKYIQAKREVVLEELYKKASELGANGIINLQIKFIHIPKDKGAYDWGYEASGMAIKK